MKNSLLDRLKNAAINFVMRERLPKGVRLCDFDRIRYEVRPGDVLLVEGHSRISGLIKSVTHSPWSHAFLYLGRLHDIDNSLLRDRVRDFYKGNPEEQLIIESQLGRGTIINTLSFYEKHHLRICRPKGLSRQDAQGVIGFSIGRLGRQYAVRHTFDLLRLMLPWRILPRRWRSSIFNKQNRTPTKEICSLMIAEAFASVKFPILPVVRKEKGGELQIYHRNPHLFTPSDFDYSPYFEIIKYPFFELGHHASYRNLPWGESETPLEEPQDKQENQDDKSAKIKKLEETIDSIKSTAPVTPLEPNTPHKNN